MFRMSLRGALTRQCPLELPLHFFRFPYSLTNSEMRGKGMHTIREIREEYDRLDALVGIDTSAAEITVPARQGRRLGSFRAPAPGVEASLRVTISPAAMADDALFRDTIRHEYAHMAVYLLHPGERHGHDAVWKAMCRVVGCEPKSTTQATEGQKQAYRSLARYKIRCRACGGETYYQRAGKIVKLLEHGRRGQVRCARCGSADLELYERRS